jgi:CubicO group peptidase (beta-lactamase class C family)
MLVPITLLLTGVLVTATEPEAQGTEPSMAAQIASIMAEWDRIDSPGCAIGVVQGNELIYKRGFGQANLDHGIPITSRTVFDIGSTSKQFTAAAVALLAERQALSLDDDIRKHLPEMPDYGRPITIRHLIHHTSGIRDYLTVMDLAGQEMHDVYTLDDVVGLIARQQGLNFTPGSEHLYSNSGYMLLAEIVERVAQQGFADFVRDNFFAPMGMADTQVYVDPTRIIPRRATGYSLADERLVVDHFYNFAVPGDGQVYTTVEDLARWDRLFYDGGVGGEDFVKGLHRVGVLDDGQELSYAFGLNIGTRRGLDTVRHGGAWGGFRAELLRFPGERTTVICLCNFGEIGAGTIANQVADIVLGDRYPSPDSSQAASAEPGQTADTGGVALPPAQLERVTGAYFNPKARYIRRIVAEEGTLFYARGGDNRTELAYLGDGRFRMVGVGVEVLVWFEPEQGPVQHMLVQIEEDELIRLDPVELVTCSAQQLAEYAGIYHSDELDVDYRLEVDGNGLRVSLPGTTQLFEPGFADFFASTESPVTLEFERLDDGAIEGFVVNAGRVRNIRFTRAERPAS